MQQNADGLEQRVRREDALTSMVKIALYDAGMDTEDRYHYGGRNYQHHNVLTYKAEDGREYRITIKEVEKPRVRV